MFNSNTLLRFQNILFGGKYIAFFYNSQQFLEKNFKYNTSCGVLKNIDGSEGLRL